MKAETNPQLDTTGSALETTEVMKQRWLLDLLAWVTAEFEITVGGPRRREKGRRVVMASPTTGGRDVIVTVASGGVEDGTVCGFCGHGGLMERELFGIGGCRWGCLDLGGRREE